MDFTKIDFIYDITANYNYETSCEESGCFDEGICRCSEIVDVVLNDIDISKVIKRIYTKYFETDLNDPANVRDRKLNSILSGTDINTWKDINLYAVDRIATIFKLWDKELYDVGVENSYYGEELMSIKLHKNIADRINNELIVIKGFSSIKEIVEYLLVLEYGNILPKLEKCNYIVQPVYKGDIIFGSHKHHKNVKDKSLTFYSDDNYDKIRGIVIKDDNKFRLIDGYHRTHTTNKTEIKMIVAIK